MSRSIQDSCPACESDVLLDFLNVPDLRVTKENFSIIRCAQCGLGMTTPRPSQAEIGLYYETDDYISHASEARSLIDRIYYWVRKRMAATKHSLLDRHAYGKKLVDIGTGTGFLSAYLRAKNWEVKAFEPSEQARHVAETQYQLEVADIPAFFHLEKGSADVVTMWHVLEHVHDPQIYLKKIFDVLNDQGILVLALPNHRSYDAGFYKSFWGAWDVPRHLWHFSPESIILMAQRFDFVVSKMYRMPFDAFYVSLISEKYKGGGFLRLARGGVIGILSNIISMFNSKRSSSVIYIFSRKSK